MNRRLFLSLLPAVCFAPAGICSPPHPNFSGTWKQSNERSSPPRKGDVVLHIDHRDPILVIETTMVSGTSTPRHAVQNYSADGKTTISKGIDGDEFHTSIVWRDQSLIWTVEEHEDGRILNSREIWTLNQDGATLERVREEKKQTIIYLREG